ncbi:MAG: nicotinamide riboside transporter PnuC [Bacteroidota bacterium]
MDWIMANLAWIATAFALIYVALAAKSNSWCWFFGAVGCSIWAYVSWKENLLSDAGLQVFYVLVSIWGWWRWQFADKSAINKVLPVSRMSKTEHAIIWGVGLPLGYILGRYLGDNFGAVATYWDAYTTVFSVIVTFAVVTRKLENWLYWILINIVTGALYFSRGLTAFGIVMIVYLVLAVVGYLSWQKELKINAN